MNKRIGSIISAAVVLVGFAAPALAETVECTVTAPEIWVRKTPSKKAPVVATLKKSARVSAAGKCADGWVKISSGDGKIAGYVGGWALSNSSTQASVLPDQAAASTEPANPVMVAVSEPVAEKVAVPTNEQLAIQITEMRLRIYGMEQKMKTVTKDIKKIKAALARTPEGAKNPAK